MAWPALWSAAFLALLYATNSGLGQRIELLFAQERLVTLVGFLGMWGMSVLCLLIAAWQPNLVVRAAWAVVIAAATAVGVGFRNASGADLTVFDAVSLWSVRHEAARAAMFYGHQALWPAVLLVGTIAFVMAAPRPQGPAARRWIARLAFAPAVPIAAIAMIIFVKEGGGGQALPVQFVPASVGVVTGAALAANATPERQAVKLTPRRPAITRNIVILIDESIRGDAIDWTPGNKTTPLLAERRRRIIDFGIAASGGTCSHYSNAILRFTAQAADLGGPILANPTIWQYAHKAGLETVYIDAQSAFNKNPGKLQNFMTVEEAADIDRFYTMDEDIPAEELDYHLLDILLAELSSETPKLIFANKNGAHFPYDDGYPRAETLFRPVVSETGAPTPESSMNSYKNVVRWSVDSFFARLLDRADLDDAIIIYTSDHGQNLRPDAMSHCSVEEPDPWEGLVPLFTATDDPDIRTRLEEASRYATPRSHFEIMPTALVLMGYGEAEVRRAKGDTLFQRATRTARFSSGDIFGLFSSKVRWHEINPRQTVRLRGFIGSAEPDPAAVARTDAALRH